MKIIHVGVLMPLAQVTLKFPNLQSTTNLHFSRPPARKLRAIACARLYKFSLVEGSRRLA
jgi:hypothetical protein